MYPRTTKDDFYRSKAAYFEGLAVMRRLTACVHLEGDSDKHFWEAVLNKYFPEGKFFFLSYSKINTDKRISGVDHCIRYIPYLSKRFFICIDSDYRYLMRERRIDVKNFILQTYTYSIENHYCFSKILESVCHKSTGKECKVFDFEQFFIDYSNIIYPLFIWHLYLVKNNLPGLTKLKFNTLLSSFSKMSIEDSGLETLRYFDQRVQNRLRRIENSYPDVDIKRYYTYFSRYGLTSDNTYLYLRGHNIYDLVLFIGRLCNRQLLAMKKAEVDHNDEIEKIFERSTGFEKQLLNSLCLEGYPEVERLADDIKWLSTLYR